MRIALSRVRLPNRKPLTLKRFRLLDLLHQNAHRKLIFVCAPAGFGKTTLLVDFANDLDASVCWYQIGNTEKNLVAFFTYLVNAVQQTYPAFGKDLISLVTDNTHPDPSSLAIEFCNEAINSIQDFTLVFLDDYHLVSDFPEVVLFIEKVFQLIPDNIRFVIGSRNFYGIPSTELYIREELTTLSNDELAFTEDELVDLSNQYFQVNLSQSEAKSIIANTEGWIIAILLALRSKNLTNAIPRLAGAKEQIFKFLHDEILSSLDPELRKFVLVSGLFPEFQVELCNHLLQISNADQFVRRLIEQNLFVSQTETGDSVYYQYHQLFRDFLDVEKTTYLTWAEIHDYQLRAAEWYQETGAVESSIDQLLLVGNLPQAADLTNQVAPEIYRTGRQAVLLDWYDHLKSLPELPERAPQLVLSIAKVFGSQGKINESLELFDQIEDILLEKEDQASLVNLLVNKGIALRFKGQFQDTLDIAEKIIPMSEQYQLDKYYVYYGERLKGMSLFFLGQVEEGIKHLTIAADGIRELNQVRKQDGLSHDLVNIMADIGYAAINTGDIFQAQKCYQEAFEVSKTIRGHLGDLAVSANNQAYIQYLIGSYQSSWNYYEQGLEAALTSGWRRIIVDIYNGRGDLLRDLTLLDQAREEYEKALAYKNDSVRDMAFGDTYLGYSDLERLTGNFNQALHYLREAAQWAQADIASPAYQVRLGRIYLTMEQTGLAEKTLRAALNKLLDGPASDDRAMARFLLAAIEHGHGELDLAGEHLLLSLADAAVLGYDQTVVGLAREHMTVVADILAKRENRHLRDIYRKAVAEPLSYSQLVEKPKPDTAIPQMKITVKAFGIEEVRVNGALIPSHRWKSARARALFFYILDKGKVTKQQISLEFWPDFSQSKVNSNFHATLWRVRNALGIKEIIGYDDNTYYLEAQTEIVYDVANFSRLVDKFMHLSDDMTEKRNIGYQILDLYHGDFLLDVDMDWADVRRAELNRQFRNCLQELADTEFSLGHFENARNLYQQLIDTDPFVEEYHIGLMSAMIKNGASIGAKKHYLEYKAFLQKELNVLPSEELEVLYSSL